MVVKTLGIHCFSIFFAFRFFWANIGPRSDIFKMGQHRVKLGQYRAQIGPTWPNGGGTAPNVGQHVPHNLANLALKRPPIWGEPGGNLGRTLRSMGFRLFCGIFVFVCFFVRLLAFLTPMLGQHGFKPGQHSPKMAQHRPRIANIALRRANIAPRWANISAPHQSC